MMEMSFLRKVNICLVLIFLLMLKLILFLPNAPGYAYAPHHIANLFLPNFGLHLEYSTFPYYANSVITQYSLNKVILVLISNNDPLMLYRLTYILTLVFRLFAYLLLFILFMGRINTNYKDNMLKIISVSLLISLVIWWPGGPFMLIVLLLWSLFASFLEYRVVLIGTISYLTLSLYWHSAGMIGFSIVIAYFVVGAFFSIDLRRFSLYVYGLITLVSWVFIRGLDYGGALRNALLVIKSFSIEYILNGLFSKGNFVPEMYAFYSNFPVPSIIVNFGLYLSYVVLLSVTLWIILAWNFDKKLRGILLTVFFANFIFMMMYFIATFTVPPVILQTLLYPLIIYILLMFKRHEFTIRSFSLVVIFILTLSFSLGTLQKDYTNTFEDTTGQTSFYQYFPSIQWMAHHASIRPIKIISDGNTNGYYQIILSKYHLYPSNVRVFKWGVTLDIYKKLIKGRYANKNSIMAVNLFLFKKHLRMVSLQAWNRFEPLPPKVYFARNNLSVIYSDDTIAFLY